MTPIEWLLSGDTGISSECICAVMTGSKFRDDSPPSDPSDFGRCYRLLQKFPEWKARMGEVAAKCPEWSALVREWDSLTDLFEAESKNKSGNAPRLYARMKVLLDEGRIAAGWTKTGPGSWRGPNRTETAIGKGITVSFGND
jgi:hypothetical protein